MKFLLDKTVTLSAFFTLLTFSLFSQDIKIVEQPSAELIHVPSEDRIYVSVPEGQINGNSICKIDPYLGIVEECFYIGGNPNALELSNDGNFLYIGLEDLPEIVKFNLSTKTIESTIDLGENFLQQKLYVEDLAVMPGQPELLAVARKNKVSNPGQEGVAVYQDGNKIGLETGSFPGVNSIVPAPSNGRLFAFDNKTIGFSLQEIVVDNQGAVTNSTTYGVLSGFLTVIKNHGNYVYSSNGQRINFETSLPYQVGTYPINTNFKTTLLPAPDSNVVYFVKNTFNEYSMLTFDKLSYELVDSLPLPNTKGDLRDMISWGDGGKIAINTTDGITIMRYCTSLITDTLSLSPDYYGGCFGDTITISAPDGYEHYRWSNGALTQSVTVHNTIHELYFYTLDSLGCSSNHSNSAIVFFTSPPNPPQILGNDIVEVCKGESKHLFATGSTDLYLWSNGETTRDIIVDEGGDYYVVNLYSSGCSSEISNIVTVIILDDTIPDPPQMDIMGVTDLCDGESVIFTAPPGYNLIKWTSGQTTPSIEIFFPTLIGVRVGNVEQCLSDFSDLVEITWKPLPPKPTIHANVNLLASSAHSGNQWYFNGELIPGADKQFLEATANGFYTVQVTVNGCVSDFADIYNHYVVSSFNRSIDDSIRYFPNPTADQINVVLADNVNHLFHAIEVFDFTGNALLRFTNTNTISLSNLPNGLYVVRVSDKFGNTLKNELISKL